MGETERFGWREWLLVLGFVLSLGLAGAAIVRSYHIVATIHRDEPIRPWMTLPYIARSYRVPSSILYQALGVQPETRDRRPLTAIARAQHRTVQDVIAALQTAIRDARASPPTPGPDLPGSAR